MNEEVKNLEAATKAVESKKAEAARELPAFENDRLFMYLVNKNYDGKSRGIVGFFDRFVARKTGYFESQSRQNYDHLKTMPELMERGLSEMKEKTTPTLAERDKRYHEVAKGIGLVDIEEKIKGLNDEKNQIISDMEKSDSDYKSYADERAKIDGADDPYLVETKSKLKQLLEGEDISYLREQARKTPDPEDDDLVSKLEEIDEQMKTLKININKTRKERDVLNNKLDGLKQIQQKARKYNGSDDYYSGTIDIKSLLTGYVMGKDAGSYTSINSTLERSHKVKEPEYHYTPSSSTYHSSSSESYHSSSGGFGGGGFSSGGGFGGGGFSSGKGI